MLSMLTYHRREIHATETMVSKEAKDGLGPSTDNALNADQDS
jgi:hypothetical protein